MTLSQKVCMLLGIALIVVVGLYLAGRAKIVPSATKTPVQTMKPAVVSPVAMVAYSHNQNDTYKSYTLQESYPQSSATELSDVYSFVQNAKTQFLSDYDSISASDAKNFPEEANSYNFMMTTRVATSTNTVSYIIETYQYEGGAHGATTVTTFTYDTAGKLVTLDDVFDKPYLSVIAPLAQKYFETTFGKDAQEDMIVSGTEATSTNYSSWYLTPNTITFIFGEYQVAAYAAGIQEFPLPKSQVGNILSQKFK